MTRASKQASKQASNRSDVITEHARNQKHVQTYILTVEGAGPDVSLERMCVITRFGGVARKTTGSNDVDTAPAPWFWVHVGDNSTRSIRSPEHPERTAARDS